MKLGIMQPYFFPYIGYYQLLYAVDKFVFLDDVNFINKGWINRNRILLNGKDFMFTVPLKNANQNRTINQIVLAEDNWHFKFLKTIELAYKKAPEFNVVYDLIKSVFILPVQHIATLAKRSINVVLEYLDIKTAIINTSSEIDDKQFHGEKRIIRINKNLGASIYINPIGGELIYAKQNFLGLGIQLKFIKTRSINYTQFDNEFIPFLSVIDVLMFNKKQIVQEMLLQFDLL